MFRVNALLVMVIAIFLSACAPGAQTVLPPDATLVPVTDIPSAASTPIPGVTALPAGEETSTPVDGLTVSSAYARYQSPSLGIQFNYPAAWYLRETSGSVTLTSFDPSDPPHKLEWTDQTTSIQFGLMVLVTPPASFDAWVDSARQTALANGLSIYEEERFTIANQPAHRLTLVSGSGGVIHQVLTSLSGRYLEINIQGNYNLAKAVLDSIHPLAATGIKPADSDTPAAGICGEAPGDPVSIVLGVGPDGIPLAGRCVQIAAAQSIKLVNHSNGPVNIQFGEYHIDLPAGNELLLDKPAGQYLALGVHSLPMGPEVWVREYVAATAPPPIVSYSNSIVGYKLGLPGNWHIDENGMTNSLYKEVIFYPPNAEPFIAYLSISLDFRTLDQIIDSYTQYYPDAVRQDTIFNGYTAIEYSFPSGRHEYFIPYGNQIFLIASDRPNDSVVQSILTTIQLTASSSTAYEATIMDNGKTFNLKVGDTLRLNLDPSYDWSAISVSDTNVIVVVQDIYQARAAGVASLTGTGDPKCLSSTPPCGMPSIVFTITVIVQ